MSGRNATAAVAARIAQLDPTGKVWDTLDDTVDPEAFAERFTSEDAIHCWEVTREGSEPIETESTSAITRRERIVAYGYYSYQTGTSEVKFQAIVDAVVAGMDPPNSRNRTFADLPDGAGYGVEWSTAPSVDGPRPARFSNFMVHLVKLTVYVSFDPIF